MSGKSAPQSPAKVAILAAYFASPIAGDPEPDWLLSLRRVIAALNAVSPGPRTAPLELYTFTADQASGAYVVQSDGRVQTNSTIFEKALALAVREHA
ncbi:MAG: hypothetical protein ACR2PL_05590, partial [Dehalococcoidia bacterium]